MQDLSDLNPYCFSRSRWSMSFAIRVCKIRAEMLYTVLRSEMGLYISGLLWDPLPLKMSTTVASSQFSGAVAL